MQHCSKQSVLCVTAGSILFKYNIRKIHFAVFEQYWQPPRTFPLYFEIVNISSFVSLLEVTVFVYLSVPFLPYKILQYSISNRSTSVLKTSKAKLWTTGHRHYVRVRSAKETTARTQRLPLQIFSVDNSFIRE